MKSSHNKGAHSHPRFRTGSEGYLYPLRLLLYSHDSVGLGHLRRNLAIAKAVAGAFPNSNILIVTGSPCATQFELPANTDLIKIPSISKDERGRYVARDTSRSLERTIKTRSGLILDAFRLFEPTLVIVDHQLIGLKGEALAMLREAKRQGVSTIYGSRDIKDSPKSVKASWQTDDSRWAISEGYDRICVYGMSELFDPREVYAPCLDGARRIDFTGYIIPPVENAPKRKTTSGRKKVLVTFGGGGDGTQRAESYLQALKIKPVNWDSHIITGPLMDAEMKRQMRKQARKIQPIGSVKVQTFHRNIPALLQQADAVVSMAGYNSSAEILQSGIPAVLLPRSFPRQEQLIRARLMAERGWVSMVPDTDINPQRLLNAVERALESPRRSKPEVNLDGLATLVRIILEQLQTAGLLNKMLIMMQSQNSSD